MKALKILAIIFFNAASYFSLCVGSFMIYAFLKDGTFGQDAGMIGAPLLVVIFVSAIAASAHTLIFGSMIGFVGDRLPNNPVISAICLGLSWLFILMIASWITSSGDNEREAPWIFAVLSILSVPSNLATILLERKTGLNLRVPRPLR